MTLRNGIIAAVLLIAALLALSWWRERTPKLTTEQAVAHEQTKAAEVKAAHAETAFVASKATAAAAEAVSAKSHAKAAKAETVSVASTAAALANLVDTMKTKQALADAATTIAEKNAALAKDSATIAAKNVALAHADTALADQKRVTASVRNELAIALSRREPRLSGTIAALYDPTIAVANLTAEVAFRVIGPYSLIARADQRLRAGEKPTVGAGVCVRF